MKRYSREVLSAPERIAENGQCCMGTFNEAFKEVNLLDIDSPLGVRLPKAVNNLRLKEWEAFQLANEEWFICLAVTNVKIMGIAFVFLYNKKSGRQYLYKKQTNPGGLRVPSGLGNSVCSYISESLSIEIHNCLDEERFSIEFSAAGWKDLPECRGSFTARRNTEPIVIVQPFADNRPLYSYKALMAGNGSLEFGDTVSAFTEENSGIIVDDHKGFYPYKLEYDWVTTIGRHEGGLIGFNLTDNQILEPGKYNENCLWIKERMIPLPPVKMDRPDGMKSKWTITDKYGRVNLTFTPLGGTLVKMNFLLASIFYYGPIGIYEGYILDDSDDKILFSNFIGMGEKRSDRM